MDQHVTRVVRAVSRLTTAIAVMAAIVLLHASTMYSQGQGPKAQGPARPNAEGRRTTAEGRPLRVLFLGHTSPHHPSMALMPILAAPLGRKGIQLTHVATPEEALRP